VALSEGMGYEEVEGIIFFITDGIVSMLGSGLKVIPQNPCPKLWNHEKAK